MPEQYRFAAFISYSSKDAAFAKRLHAALERYGIPNTLGKFDLEIERGKRNRIYPVFRDREELSAGDLGDRIKQALQQSRALIVICSPNSASSHWVQKEIETFLDLGRRERVYAIIAPNAPLIDDNGEDATRLSFPPAFRNGDLGGPSTLEPIAADARVMKDGFRNAWLKLVAGMIGVNAGALQDRDRSSRRMRLIQNAVALILASFALVAVFQTQSRWQPTVNQYLHYGRFAVAKGALPARLPADGFRDCEGPEYCPQMVIIPKGQFIMGSAATERDRRPDEGPQHWVAIARFAASKYDITIADWSGCIAGGGCRNEDNEPIYPDRSGQLRDEFPVTNVSWYDAQIYVKWLSQKTGQKYRLLTEAEWEYAARGATVTAYPWGDEIGVGNASCYGCGDQWGGKQPAPVGSFKSNAFGLYDMAGNVEQWVEDCYHATYVDAPTNGYPAWPAKLCDLRVSRGGAWNSPPSELRASRRGGSSPSDRDPGLGFRVARTLSPT